MDVVVRTGGCLCGAVRYSVRGEPVYVGCCHCANCRKESGSAFTVYAHWPLEAFEMSGDISTFDARGFCPRCGSRLLDLSEPGDTHIEIRIGTLDDAPFDLKPESEIWVKRRGSPGFSLSRVRRSTTRTAASDTRSYDASPAADCSGRSE